MTNALGQTLTTRGLTPRVAACVAVAGCAVLASGFMRSAVGTAKADAATASMSAKTMVAHPSALQTPTAPRTLARAENTEQLMDYLAFQTRFAAGDPSADMDGNGELNAFDFTTFLDQLHQGS